MARSSCRLLMTTLRKKWYATQKILEKRLKCHPLKKKDSNKKIVQGKLNRRVRLQLSRAFKLSNPRNTNLKTSKPKRWRRTKERSWARFLKGKRTKTK